MRRLNLLLVAIAHQLCLASTVSVIDNGLGVTQSGLEEKIVDFAILAADEKADLPSQVCLGFVCTIHVCLFSSLYVPQWLRMLSPTQFVPSNFSASLGLPGSTFALMETAYYSRYR